MVGGGGVSARETPFVPLPINVGITGHRDIPPECAPELEARIEALLRGIQALYPHSPVNVLSPLADGADRLGARAALKAGCPLSVPLPMAREEYERDFDESSQREFGELLLRASDVFVAEPSAPPESPKRGFYYGQAGLYIARNAHVLIALWDGTETLFPEGGGTYETICFMRQENGIVIHIPTPRMSNPAARLPSVQNELRKDEHLAIIDDFNREIMNRKPKLDSIIAESKLYVLDEATEKTLDSGLSALLRAFLYADALAVLNRNRKLLTLRLLSALGLWLVLSFLLYDEMESNFMLFVYGAIIIAAGVVYMAASRGKYHEKYILYRTLAEALRVQFYWALGGIGEEVFDSYTLIQKSELDFVGFIAKSIGINRNRPNGSLSESARACVRRFWFGGQYAYHSASAAQKGKQHRINTSSAQFMLAMSVLLFLITIIMELFFERYLQQPVPINDSLRLLLQMHNGQSVIWRSALKIALGVVSAGTAFLANYYGSLSLPQQIFNNQRMHTLYESVLKPDSASKLEDSEAMRILGRESLLESASWYLSQRDNTQKLFIN